MKTNILSIRTLSIIALSIVTMNCSARKKDTIPSSLYKTPEGQEIANKSYEKSMELWDVEYEEEYVET